VAEIVHRIELVLQVDTNEIKKTEVGRVKAKKKKKEEKKEKKRDQTRSATVISSSRFALRSC
jgi:hypothetical protein